MENKLKLYGFNNLTKALSFNIYDVCYAKTEREQQKYIAYIDEQYNSDRLVKILTNVSQMIGAEVLNISKQDYDPQGASVTLLLAEDAAIKRADSRLVLGHLDKSHVTAHTYPEYHPETCIATFRVDIDVETCGEITPLSTLDYLIGSFDSDIIRRSICRTNFSRSRWITACVALRVTCPEKSCLSTMTSRRSRTISTPKFWHVTMPSTSTSIRRTSSTRTCSSKSWICRTTCSTWMPTSFRLRPGWTSAPVCGRNIY